MTLGFLQVAVIQGNPHLHHSNQKLDRAKKSTISTRIPVTKLQSKGRKMTLGFLQVAFIQGNPHLHHSTQKPSREAAVSALISKRGRERERERERKREVAGEPVERRLAVAMCGAEIYELAL